MGLQQQLSQQDVEVRRFERADTVEFVADFGRADATVDIVDDTAIVVADGEQHDLQLPDASNAEAFMKNGVLTVEVRA